jgi:hypothetical protein
MEATTSEGARSSGVANLTVAVAGAGESQLISDATCKTHTNIRQ